MEALFHEEQGRVDALLGEGPWAGAVGAFEGAMYAARGYYRPQANCMMFTRTTEFCAVCRRALETLIDLYSRPPARGVTAAVRARTTPEPAGAIMRPL